MKTDTLNDLHSSSALLEKAKELREITRVLTQQKKKGIV